MRVKSSSSNFCQAFAVTPMRVSILMNAPWSRYLCVIVSKGGACISNIYIYIYMTEKNQVIKQPVTKEHGWCQRNVRVSFIRLIHILGNMYKWCGRPHNHTFHSILFPCHRAFKLVTNKVNVQSITTLSLLTIIKFYHNTFAITIRIQQRQ